MSLEVIALAIGCTVFGSGATLLVRFDRADRKKRVAVRERRARRLERLNPEPDQGIDPFVDEDTDRAPALPGGLRFALGSGVTDLGVRFRSMRRAFAGETAILNATAGELNAVSFRPTASIFADPPQHFISPHIDAELAAILDSPSWANVKDLSLLEELTRRQPGAPTGQYAIVRTSPDRPIPNDPGGAPRPARLRLTEVAGPDPERAAAARLMHLAASKAGA